MKWEIIQQADGLYAVFEKAGNMIASDISINHANLIASAPDLLDEARNNLVALESVRDCSAMLSAPAVERALIQKRLDATRAAIAKATEKGE